MKRKLKQLNLPYQVAINDVVARSGFVVNSQGVTEITAEGPLAVVKRKGAPDLVFAGNWYGSADE